MSGLSKRTIDGGHIVGTAGHGTDDERGGQGFAQYRGTCIDVGHVELGQGFVGHAPVGKIGADTFGCHIFIKDDADMV